MYVCRVSHRSSSIGGRHGGSSGEQRSSGSRWRGQERQRSDRHSRASGNDGEWESTPHRYSDGRLSTPSRSRREVRTYVWASPFLRDADGGPAELLNLSSLLLHRNRRPGNVPRLHRTADKALPRGTTSHLLRRHQLDRGQGLVRPACLTQPAWVLPRR